jgi:hypothetical protein
MHLRSSPQRMPQPGVQSSAASEQGPHSLRQAVAAPARESRRHMHSARDAPRHERAAQAASRTSSRMPTLRIMCTCAKGCPYAPPAIAAAAATTNEGGSASPPGDVATRPRGPRAPSVPTPTPLLCPPLLQLLAPATSHFRQRAGGRTGPAMPAPRQACFRSQFSTPAPSQ